MFRFEKCRGSGFARTCSKEVEPNETMIVPENRKTDTKIEATKFILHFTFRRFIIAGKGASNWLKQLEFR